VLRVSTAEKDEEYEMIHRTVPGRRPGDFFTILEEALPSGRLRTIRIHGPIHRFHGPRSSLTGPPDRSAFDDWGHLIAHQLGGPPQPSSGNIVPMHALINQRGHPWANMEQEIVKRLNTATAMMVVCPNYRGGEVRPYAFSVSVAFSDGHVGSWFIHNYNPYLTFNGGDLPP
jgi:hypothetical protein